MAILALTVAFAGAAAGSAELWRTLTAEDEAKVAKGQVVVQVERKAEGVKRFQVVGLVNAPISRVWDVYTDFGKYDTIFKITGSAVRKRDGNTVYGWFYLALMWPTGPRWTVNETVLDPGSYTFTYRRVEGTFKHYDGDLELREVAPRKTRVRYSARIDPDTPYLPSWFLDFVQFHMLPTAITRVRDYIGTEEARKSPRDTFHGDFPGLHVSRAGGAALGGPSCSPGSATFGR